LKPIVKWPIGSAGHRRCCERFMAALGRSIGSIGALTEVTAGRRASEASDRRQSPCNCVALRGQWHESRRQESNPHRNVASWSSRPNLRIAAKESWCRRLAVKSASSTSAVDDDPVPPGCSRVKVELSKPLGLVLEENKARGGIFVAEVLPGGNAAKTGLIAVGDELIATSAIVFDSEMLYGEVKVKKGEKSVRIVARGQKFDTVMAAIGSHPAYKKVTIELEKCAPQQ